MGSHSIGRLKQEGGFKGGFPPLKYNGGTKSRYSITRDFVTVSRDTNKCRHYYTAGGFKGGATPLN